MKLIPFLLLLFALNPFVQKPQRKVLYDFRIDHVSTPAKIPVASERAILNKVFRRYLTDANKCRHGFEAGEDYLADARKAGQMVPDIAEIATGSFTAAGRNETAYVIFVNECNASHADNFGTKRVAIFSGQQLVTDVDVDFNGDIALKTDLNGDGINELLMTGGDMAQGTITQTAALLSFENGRMRVVQDFGTVVEDSCASEMPGSAAKAAVLSLPNAAPGKVPTIRVDRYAAGCSKVKRWRPVREF